MDGPLKTSFKLNQCYRPKSTWVQWTLVSFLFITFPFLLCCFIQSSQNLFMGTSQLWILLILMEIPARWQQELCFPLVFLHVEGRKQSLGWYLKAWFGDLALYWSLTGRVWRPAVCCLLGNKSEVSKAERSGWCAWWSSCLGECWLYCRWERKPFLFQSYG